MNISRLLEGTGDAAFAVDEYGVIQCWNRAAESLFGYCASEAIGMQCFAILKGRDALSTPICDQTCSVLYCAHTQRRLSNYDMEVQVRSGAWHWVNISTVVVDENAKKDDIFLLHFVRDITDQKKAESLSEQLIAVAHNLIGIVNSNNGPSASPLTNQERRILQLFASGKDTTVVAGELSISSGTLRNHLHHINEKLKAHNRLEAVMIALSRRLL